MTNSSKVCSLYRNLLRTVGHSVRFQRQDVKNLRRSLRDDYNQILQTSPTLADVEKKGRPSREPKDERRQGQNSTFPLREAIAARVMLNLSSITYHHLSPNTVMQTKGRTAIAGGSDSKYMRQIRSKRDLKRRVNDRISAQSQGEGVSIDEMEVGDMGSRLITSLFVPHRRQRGPTSGPPDSRQFNPRQWNGQKADGNMKQTEYALITMKESIDQLENKFETLKKTADVSGKCNDKEKAEQALKDWRSRRKIFLAEENKFQSTKQLQEIRSNAASLLHSITQRAESSTGACLGSARIGRLARGEWLPP